MHRDVLPGEQPLLGVSRDVSAASRQMCSSGGQQVTAEGAAGRRSGKVSTKGVQRGQNGSATAMPQHARVYLLLTHLQTI